MAPVPLSQDPLIALVIDDNVTIRQLIAWSLHTDGFHPVEAANGLEAIAWMEQAAREQMYPTLILLDLMMPDMDGRSFLAWLQSSWVGRHPVPPLILLTASPLRVGENFMTLYPFVKQIISKPFHIRDLLESIHRFV